MCKKKVMLGMSGGVDSSVAALLLLRAGYEVTGVTMRLRPEAMMRESTAGGCCSLDDIDDARRVCYQLGIEHMVLNFTEEFEKYVIEDFAAQYAAGRTPNPCIACNRYLKFGGFLRRAQVLGYDYIATGHYARIFQGENGRWQLCRAQNAKDQSYVLYSMTQEQLAHTLMPLGEYTKPEARDMAREAGLSVAQKPDSQEICFVEDNDYAGFLERYTGIIPPQGDFVDEAGKVLGRHQGITRYTIGQRKGLGIAFGKPMYVIRIDAEANQVTLGEEGRQYASSVVVSDVNWIAIESLGKPLRAMVKIRYQAVPAPALLTPLENGKVLVEFDAPQRSITPGQAIVFYDAETAASVLGGSNAER